MSYMNREDRRSSIVDAAMEIALSDGLSAITVRAIANALKVSPGQIHHNFESISEIKAEALRAAVLKISSPSGCKPVSDVPHQRLFEAVVGDQENWDVQAASLWNEALYIARQDQFVGKMVQTLVLAWIDQITSVVRDGQASGNFLKAESPNEIANRLAVIAMGLDRLGALNHPDYSREAVYGKIREAIEREIGSGLTIVG